MAARTPGNRRATGHRSSQVINAYPVKTDERCGSQAVRQWFAKPSHVGSNPIRTSGSRSSPPVWMGFRPPVARAALPDVARIPSVLSLAMFLGHFGVGLAAKRAAPAVSLGLLFLAAQFVDLLWPTLLLLDVERVAIAPGDTALTPLAFTDYPISHSLLAVLGWGALFALVYKLC